jgi:cytochrome c1
MFAAWMGEAERRVRFGQTDGAARTLLLAIVCIAGLASWGCLSSNVKEAEALTGGDVRRGKLAVGHYGCGACHVIPGIGRATGTVGPPLDRIAMRQYLGGHLPNTPGNMVRWIRQPQSVDPKNAMPDLGVSEQDAADIAALLYTLR